MPKCVDLLKDGKSKQIFSMICEGGSAGVEKMSDFEKFAFMCQSLNKLTGNALKNDFLSALGEEAGCTLSFEALCDRELQKQLWRHLYSNYKPMWNITDNSAKPTFDALLEVCPSGTEASSFKNAFDLDLLFSGKCELWAESLEKAIENTVEYLVGNGISKIVFNTENCLYVRPDIYHSRLAFDKISSGEKCNTEELSMLKLWVLFSLLKADNMSVSFRIKDGIETAKCIIERMEAMKINAEPSICFNADALSLTEQAARLCLEKNISSEIIFSEETDMSRAEKSLSALAYSIPISRVLPCTCIHGNSGDNAFYRVLCGFLSENCETHSEAETYIKSILV